MAKEAQFNLDPDYYRKVHPFITGTMIVVLWMVLPLLAFFPHVFEDYVSQNVMQLIETHHYNIIKMMNVHIWLHMIECFVTVEKCRKYGINSSTTLKWMGNVALHGIFALKFLLWPDENARKIKVH